MIESMDPVIINSLKLIYLSISTFLALFGNSLVLLILSRPEFMKVPMFRYLIAATLFDTINVLLSVPFVFPEPFQIYKNSFSCKLFNYLTYIVYNISPWILSLSSIDRYLSIKYPKGFDFRNKFKFQFFAMVIIFFSISLIDVPYLIFYEVSNKTDCAAKN